MAVMKRSECRSRSELTRSRQIGGCPPPDSRAEKARKPLVPASATAARSTASTTATTTAEPASGRSSESAPASGRTPTSRREPSPSSSSGPATEPTATTTTGSATALLGLGAGGGFRLREEPLDREKLVGRDADLVAGRERSRDDTRRRLDGEVDLVCCRPGE